MERDSPESPTPEMDMDASNMNPNSAVIRNNSYSNYNALETTSGNAWSNGENKENDEKRVTGLAETAFQRTDSPMSPPSERRQGGIFDNGNSRWGGGLGMGSPPIEVPIEVADPQPETLEYLMTYPTIRTAEQRNRYKADFNADYNEYRELHAVVERVSRRFHQLDDRLKQKVKDSPDWKSVKYQIVIEYQNNKQDLNLQGAKIRFWYLHEKLSHIKRLVLEYDSTNNAENLSLKNLNLSDT